ncbi:MAG: DUF1847 domain-containing protein [bacterium]|nr:DUF1847 domain-containing protein [bacterium]
MNTITCEKCSKTKCKTGIDCYSIKEQSILEYQKPFSYELSKSASSLIDNGRAGTLGRLEEIIEFSKMNKYKKIGLAYCIGFDPIIKELSNILRENSLEPIPVVCTAGGVQEKDIDPSKTVETTSCNPAGQAILFNEQKVDFIIEIGLCLGHDVIFHSKIDIPFSVLIVKDRVNYHNPGSVLNTFPDANKNFIENLDNSFAMKSPHWLKEKLTSNDPLTIIDLRGKEAFDKSNIHGSINIPLKELPGNYKDLLPEKNNDIVCLCNGSVQSAYAIMFLYSRGYKKVHNLSGGFSRWEKENNSSS